MIFLLDNFDSFVYNLAAYFKEQGAATIVKRADEVTLAQVKELQPKGIVISPGPKRPSDARLAIEIVREFQGKIPILGVCLGHQVISHACGAKVVKGVRPFHGKVTPIINNGTGVFAGLPEKFLVTRYHSLVVKKDSLPPWLQVDATSVDGVVMAISHTQDPVYGVQFHPEAILSEYGHELLANYIQICRKWSKQDGKN